MEIDPVINEILNKLIKCIICLQIKFYATIQPYIVYEYSNVERGQEHGIEGTDLNFEFKMASLGNVVFIDRRIIDQGHPTAIFGKISVRKTS